MIPVLIEPFAGQRRGDVAVDIAVGLAGLLVGFVVGLTGMGGGALMTPMLVLFFNVQPLAAVSSDLVASMVMKPVGGAVHLRRGTVNRDLVKWLCIGSVPAAFAGVVILRTLGEGEQLQSRVKTALGVALLVAASALVFKSVLTMRERAQVRRRGGPVDQAGGVRSIDVRPVPTVLVGLVGGLVVGMTSVGSGSLIIVALLLLYPKLKSNELVGTDLVQAVPLVAAASIGHLLLGDFQLGLTASLLVGALPGVYVGARVSSAAPSGVVRRALVVVLLASSMKLLEVGNGTVLVVLGALAILGPILWALLLRRFGGGEASRAADKQAKLRLLLSAAVGRRFKPPQPEAREPEPKLPR